MKQILVSCFFVVLLSQISHGQSIVQPVQPEAGHGGKAYTHQEVKQFDYAKKPDGYWLYEPAAPRPASAPVIVFLHGYGAYNPMIYGNWIRHLVLQGNIVIFPRYQRNLISPGPDKFAANAATGIRDAIEQLQTGEHVRPELDQLIVAGHSYGGVVAANLATNFKAFEVPKIDALLLCSPGTGPFKGGILDSYEKMPEDVKMLVAVSVNDRTVGEKFGHMVYHATPQVLERNLIRQHPDDHGQPGLTAGHNEAYSPNLDFDTGVRNVSARRALRIGKTDAMDYFGYWKLFDALIECTRHGAGCQVAFGDTIAQHQLGVWSDGVPLRALEVHVPIAEAPEAQAVGNTP
ncbi:MAG: alpha/beta fold hydrolase [Bacteroidota bacterium]